MQFVETERGLVNLAFVRRIDRAQDGRAMLFVQDDGFAMSILPYEDIEERLGTFIPDHTGSISMHVGEDQGKVYHIDSPVVG
ncbi:MAG: hypothetical protein ACOH2H_15455 [Cypionkella sp.]